MKKLANIAMISYLSMPKQRLPGTCFEDLRLLTRTEL